MRLVSAGIPRAIAQRLALAAIAALAAAAPAAADPLGETAAATAAAAGAPAAQATQGVAQALPAVERAAGAVPQAAEPVRRAAEAVPRTAKRATRAVDAVQRVAESGRRAAEPVQRAAQPVQGAAAEDSPASPPVADALRTVASPVEAGPGGSLRAGTEVADSAAPALDELSRGAPLDEALRSLDDGLRSLLSVDALGAPLAGLLSGAGLGDLAPGRLALGPPRPGGDPLALGGDSPLPSARDVLGAQAQPPALALPASAVAVGPALTSSQSASAQPPAVEAGGRPGSSSPRKAPVPATGGAAAAAPSGLSFVPFLGLLVLGALAAPMLLRSLRAAPASLRPAPFICALERPG